MEWLTSILSGGGFGALIGVGGTIAKYFIKKKEDENKRKHAIAMAKLEMEESAQDHLREMAILEQHGKIQTSRIEAEGEMAEIDLRKASMESDKASYGGGWVDNLRGSTRPVLTYFGFISCVIMVACGIAIPPFIANLTSTAVTWWFGDRTIK